MIKINISQVDSIFANGLYPIEFLIYYKSRLKTKNIRSALKRLSAPFWPMFGEYRGGVIQFQKYDENKYFDEIKVNREFDSEEPAEAIYDRYHQSIPQNLKNLFFLKIIHHKNGTILIPKLNHLAGDGYSYFYFLLVLAALSHHTYVPFKKNIMYHLYKPCHNRTVLKEFQLPDFDFGPVKVEEMSTIEFKEISKGAIRKIVHEVAVNHNQKVSTNDILSAIALKRLITVQKRSLGSEFQLTIPIDVRRHIKEYGKKFFGNGILLHVINFKIEELELFKVEKLAIKMRQSMPIITKSSYLNYLENIEAIISDGQTHKLRPFDPEHGSLVTNLSKLPVNKLNFGAGEADFIFPITVEENSAAILAHRENYILRLAF